MSPSDRHGELIPGGRQSSRATTSGPAIAVLAALLGASIAIGGCLPSSIRPTPTAVPSPSPTPTAPPTPTPTPGPPTPTPAPTFAVYTVKHGDTLLVLAKQFKTTGRSIAYWNRDAYPSLDPESPDYAPDRLQVGWSLRILPGQEYVPSPSDFETGIDVTPTPDDEDYESPGPGDSTGP